MESALVSGSRCSAANWSEIAQKIIAAQGDWDLSRALLLSYGLTLEPVLPEDAEWAARRWRKGDGLSLADRLCLALGHRVDEVVLTSDTTWGHGPGIRQIR